MSKIENVVQEYSTKKLNEILEKQIHAYNENFINCIKDELIKRGESFPFNTEYEQEIKKMDDSSLRTLVENDWDDYHLEYIELARIEYLKRNFKNDKSGEEQNKGDLNDVESKYPALKVIANVYYLSAWILGFASILIVVTSFEKKDGFVFWVSAMAICALVTLGLFAVSEAIKLFVDIEENTRKNSE